MMLIPASQQWTHTRVLTSVYWRWYPRISSAAASGNDADTSESTVHWHQSNDADTSESTVHWHQSNDADSSESTVYSYQCNDSDIIESTVHLHHTSLLMQKRPNQQCTDTSVMILISSNQPRTYTIPVWWCRDHRMNSALTQGYWHQCIDPNIKELTVQRHQCNNMNTRESKVHRYQRINSELTKV